MKLVLVAAGALIVLGILRVLESFRRDHREFCAVEKMLKTQNAVCDVDIVSAVRICERSF